MRLVTQLDVQRDGPPQREVERLLELGDAVVVDHLPHVADGDALDGDAVEDAAEDERIIEPAGRPAPLGVGEPERLLPRDRPHDELGKPVTSQNKMAPKQLIYGTVEHG